ncbi:MAG TPA: hypothetical protein VMH80_07590 [Bryobacteraceae bacterium]|nr:hypothetical protein [Bryobacteraceae bacterium]
MERSPAATKGTADAVVTLWEHDEVFMVDRGINTFFSIEVQLSAQYGSRLDCRGWFALQAGTDHKRIVVANRPPLGAPRIQIVLGLALKDDLTPAPVVKGSIDLQDLFGWVLYTNGCSWILAGEVFGPIQRDGDFQLAHITLDRFDAIRGVRQPDLGVGRGQEPSTDSNYENDSHNNPVSIMVSSFIDILP